MFYFNIGLKEFLHGGFVRQDKESKVGGVHD